MKDLLKKHTLILMEAAVSEPLRRAEHIVLHPKLTVSPLIYDETGRNELKRLYKSYVRIAKEAELPFLMCTPTWRANKQRVTESKADPNINSDAVDFMKELRDDQGSDGAKIKIGGMVGCKNDCYQPSEGLSVSEAEQFHSWQIARLAQAKVDFLIAETLPNIQEAAGIAKAMEKTSLPYIISFVIGRDGRVLDGTDLSGAVDFIDAATKRSPLGYMINCSYPTFLCAADQPAALFERLIGFQANASSLDHCDLDGSDRLHKEDVSDWVSEMSVLNSRYAVPILGGCCGTGVEHLRRLVEKYHGNKG